MSSAVSTSDDSPPTHHKLSIEQRARSVPYKRPFVIAIISTLIFYLSIIALATCAITFLFVSPDFKRSAAYAMVGMLPACAFFWTIAYFKRRKASCPLCKCTPFLDNLAHKHQKAIKLRPLNYGTTAVLNVVCTQRWRCMYCGTPFDILKDKQHREFPSDKGSEETTKD
ncbi:MAG: hypothetical protein ACPGUY_06790 [Akkermansiaceae bacterium]